MLRHSILVFPNSNKHILGLTPRLSDYIDLDRGLGSAIEHNRTQRNFFANQTLCAVQLNRNTIV